MTSGNFWSADSSINWSDKSNAMAPRSPPQLKTAAYFIGILSPIRFKIGVKAKIEIARQKFTIKYQNYSFE